jgi:hypothetical protein
LEEKQKEAEYPDEAYRTLLAIQALSDGGPISLWDLSREMNVFNHRSLERPVSHILSQCPEIGRLDLKNLVLELSEPRKASSLVQELIQRYEEFYERREIRPTPQQPSRSNEVLARIKKLNNPSDSMQFYSKW